MDEPRDDIDTWLEERVTPLLPHPGAFERVRRRARRRKAARAALTAAGAVVVLAGAITVPRLVLNQVGGTPVAGPGTTAPVRGHSAGPGPTPTGTSGPDITSATPTPTAAPVPANFQPSSITFVSTTTGWAIGQAGVPGHCGPPSAYICTSIAVTNDGGATWHGLPAPVAGAPDGGTGVSQIRSLNGKDAWAFGPQLYATHDGGAKWTRIPTHGLRVTGLEAENGLVFAIWARCAGTGADFAADCTSFTLYSAPANTNTWLPVPGMTGLSTSAVPGGPGQPSSAQLVLTGARGYLLAPDGAIYSGPFVSGAAWRPALAGNGTAALGCGKPGPAQADGVPGSTMLASTGVTPAGGAGLVELCLPQAPGGPAVVAYSADGGQTWTPAGTAPGAGSATSLSGTPTGQVLVATGGGIDVSATVAGAGDLRWRTRVTGASVPGGFTFVGMTTSSQGVAIPADTGQHAVWFSYDGGRHWGPSQVR
jgi:hypothetical protein